MRAMAATNLSFIYFLEGDYQLAEKQADIAIKADRYNAKALVNKGNCLYTAGTSSIYHSFVQYILDLSVLLLFNTTSIYKYYLCLSPFVHEFYLFTNFIPPIPPFFYPST